MTTACTPSLALSSATSSEIFSVNGAGGGTFGATSLWPLTVPPEPTPTDSASPAPTSSDSPSPVPTVTITQTVQPTGPSEVSGTVKLDGGQYLGLTSGIVLLLLFVVAVLVSQLRRP